MRELLLIAGGGAIGYLICKIRRDNADLKKELEKAKAKSN